MTPQEFASELESKCPPSLKLGERLHPMVYEEFHRLVAEKTNLYQPDYGELWKRSEKAISQDKKRKQSEKESVLWGEPGSRETVEADAICVLFEEWVVRIRKKIGLRRKLRSAKQARAWIEQKVEEDHHVYLEMMKDPALQKEIEYRFDEGEEENLTNTLPPALFYPHERSRKANRRSKSVQALAAFSPLWLLAWRVHILALRTPFDPDEITWWILTGRKPKMLRYQVFRHRRYPSSKTPYSWFTIEIKARDVSVKELGKIYKKLRSQPGLKRQKPSPVQQRICQLVKEMGGWEGKPLRATAKQILAKIQREGFTSMKSWRSVVSAYDQIAPGRRPKRVYQRRK